jgi:hypothetical protein
MKIKMVSVSLLLIFITGVAAGTSIEKKDVITGLSTSDAPNTEEQQTLNEQNETESESEVKKEIKQKLQEKTEEIKQEKRSENSRKQSKGFLSNLFGGII